MSYQLRICTSENIFENVINIVHTYYSQKHQRHQIYYR